MTEFNNAHEVRAMLKPHGFNKIKVKYMSNPFGGAGLYFVTLTDIPAGVTLIHSSGSKEPSKTYGDNAEVVGRIAKLRDLLKETNASVNH